MLCGNLNKRIIAAIICLSIFLIITTPVFATESHEDPEIAKPVFSGISFLRYYSVALDFVLQKNPAEVKARLEKMPFANIPESLEYAAGSFASSGINISHLVNEIDKDLGTLRELTGQSRLEEAAELATGTLARLSQARVELGQIEQATRIAGDELKAGSAPAGSDLRHSYDELLEKIDKIREMLDLYQSLLFASLLGFFTVEDTISTEEAAELAEQLAAVIEEQREAGVSEEFIQQLEAIIEMLKKPIITAEEAAELAEQLAAVIEEQREAGILAGLLSILANRGLDSTTIILKIKPTAAFVGDKISFEGILTSAGKPLPGREINILLNSSKYSTAKTDADGHYQGTLQVPYWYIPNLNVQALYYPQDKDRDMYIASLSPAITVEVLFYESDLKITMDDKAYPGLQTTVAGNFDYGQSPPLNTRRVEIYLDNVLITEIMGRKAFTQIIEVDPEISLGQHIITVSAKPAGRYSRAVTSAILNVTTATPILGLSIPRMVITPGNVGLNGKLYSEVGPLSKASVTIGLGKSQVELVSSEDGAFNAKIWIGMSLGLVGTQDLVIQVLPQEPWHSPLVITKSMVIANMVNCGGILIILVFLGIYLPRRLQGKAEVHLERVKRRTAAITQPVPGVSTPVYSEGVPSTVLAKENDKPNRERGILGILTFMAFYLPRRLQRKAGLYLRRKERQTATITQTASNIRTLVYSERSPTIISAEETNGTYREPRDRISYWYQLLVRVIQATAKIFLKPQQTLREFASEISKALGPAAKYFLELTKMVESLLYSPYIPTEVDIENGRLLTNKIEESIEPPLDTLPIPSRQLTEEGKGAQPELNDLSDVDGERVFEFGDTFLTTSPWGQTSTWLWVLLILAVGYYACILLILLPLLIATLAY
ncbi:hypothetical protein ACFLT8_05360 [Chloroflexota bacterium]